MAVAIVIILPLRERDVNDGKRVILYAFKYALLCMDCLQQNRRGGIIQIDLLFLRC